MNLGGLLVTLVLLIIGAEALIESSVINSIVPFTLHPSLVGSFLSGIVSISTAITPQCYVCNVVAALATRAPCVRSGNCNKETAKLVKFYCVKA